MTSSFHQGSSTYIDAEHTPDPEQTGPEPTESVLARIGWECLDYITCRVGGNDVIHAERCQSYNCQRAAYARMEARRRDAANGVDVSDHAGQRFVQVTGGTINPVSVNDLRRSLEYPYNDEVYGAMYAAHGGQMVLVRVVATSPVRPDEDDYTSQSYAVVSDSDAVYGRFTTRSDGRA